MKRCLTVVLLVSALFSCSSDSDPAPTQEHLDQEAEKTKVLLVGKWMVTEYSEFFEGKETKFETYQCEMLGRTPYDLINNTYEFKSDGTGVAAYECNGGGENDSTWELVRSLEPNSSDQLHHYYLLFQYGNGAYYFAFTTVEVKNENKMYFKKFIDESRPSTLYMSVTLERI